MWRVHILAFICLLATAGSAAATHQAIPPDNSGAGQYTENVPGAGGDKPSDGLGGGSGGPGGSGSGPGGSSGELSPDAEAALGSLASKGPVGAHAAALARAGAEPRASDNARGNGPTGSENAEGGSFLSEVLRQLAGTDSDGMGMALPIIIALSFVAALLLVLARRRRPDTSTRP
jgi:hypothetical protein